MSSRKCKFKQHYDTITQPLEWSKSKTLTTPNADKEMQQPKLSHDWWRCKTLQPLWKTVWQCLTKLNVLLPYDPAITLLGIYPKELKTCPHKNPHMDVYSSFICNCQNLEANRKFFSRWIDKHWNVIYLEIKTSELTWWKDVEYLQCILLSERSQSENITCYIVTTMWHCEMAWLWRQ